MELESIISALRQAFPVMDIRRAVLTPEWLEENINNNIASTGFCYAASEVIYRLTGGRENWKKVSISRQNWMHGGHCYLINKHTNQRLDITSGQYENRNIVIPYDLGVPGGFRRISQQAITLSELAGLGELK
jgi:hypothetical protein